MSDSSESDQPYSKDELWALRCSVVAGGGLSSEQAVRVFLTLDAARTDYEARINTPQVINFVDGVRLEAIHQRDRWGKEHDARKTPADWFWLVGYLAGKALHALTSGDTQKALHHCVSTAAALANWHAAILNSTGLGPDLSRENP
jgi:hypothetical protein